MVKWQLESKPHNSVDYRTSMLEATQTTAVTVGQYSELLTLDLEASQAPMPTVSEQSIQIY